MTDISKEFGAAEEDLVNSELTVKAGAKAGFAGALAVMAVIGVLLVLSGEGIFMAARMIASVLMGEAASSGFLPVVFGTVIHLVTGTVLGVIFAWVMPRTYRSIWVVAGLLYGVAAWVVSYFFVLRPLFPVARELNAAYALLLAHAVYGIILGVVGSRSGLSSWAFRWRTSE